MRFRSSQSGSPTRRAALQLRQVRPGVVLVRASNDTVVDEYGTTITVEALMRDWLPAFWEHRTISLQHNLPELRGIRGKPFVGRATRVDFTPQLEVEVEVLDPETRQLLAEGRIGGASLEFVPLESRTQRVGDQESEVYYRLASEPELAGLTLTDLPGLVETTREQEAVTLTLDLGDLRVSRAVPPALLPVVVREWSAQHPQAREARLWLGSVSVAEVWPLG